MIYVVFLEGNLKIAEKMHDAVSAFMMGSESDTVTQCSTYSTQHTQQHTCEETGVIKSKNPIKGCSDIILQEVTSQKKNCSFVPLVALQYFIKLQNRVC